MHGCLCLAAGEVPESIGRRWRVLHVIKHLMSLVQCRLTVQNMHMFYSNICFVFFYVDEVREDEEKEKTCLS